MFLKDYDIGMLEKQEIFTIMGGRVKMHRGIYNPTSDAVWLAAFVHGHPKTALDAGIGTGGVALCIMAHHPNIKMTGIDISTDMLNDCAKNVQLNNQEIELINDDIMSWRTTRTFDLVVSNPPYFKGMPAKHNAHHNVNLVEWTKKCVARTRPNGTFIIIVDAAATAEVLAPISAKCGNIEIMPLFSKKCTAERVLISGHVGTKKHTKLYSGINMNCDAILRDGLTIEEYLAMLTKL